MIQSHQVLYDRACKVVPGGVNSPVRAFNGVGGTPLYVESGSGFHIRTADGRRLVDYCCSWGAMIMGHAHPEIVEAIQERAALGTTFGINTPDEVLLAERLCELVPGMERVRLVNSGTEAVMTALRIARGVTGRRGIIKFDGCYHGHSDSVLVAAGSGLLTGGISGSLGVPEEVAADTFVLPYNDLSSVDELIRVRGSEVAAIIVEPVAGNMGLVEPAPGFLAGLQRAAQRCGALLICDEVINGFRFGLSSYSSGVGITPDLITLGKVIGGGLPLAAVGGRAELMDQLAPGGGIYQAGTLSGNPLAVAAGMKTLELLELEQPYQRMAELGALLAEMINEGAERNGLPIQCANLNGIFTVFCSDKPVYDLASAKLSDTSRYARLFHKVLDQGYYLAPSQFELGFISAAHTQAQIEGLAKAVLSGAA